MLSILTSHLSETFTRQWAFVSFLLTLRLHNGSGVVTVGTEHDTWHLGIHNGPQSFGLLWMIKHLAMIINQKAALHIQRFEHAGPATKQEYVQLIRF